MYATEQSYNPEDDQDAIDAVNATDPAGAPMRLLEYRQILEEIENQPHWRAQADKEMEYVDGNQLSSELLNRQKAVGIPPAIENLIGPAIRSLQGYEAITRTDWRVSPDGDVGGQDVADALNFRLNQAERASRADSACTEAFRPQVCVGIGWVEVSRESDPFKFPYRCKAVHRNEIHWDMRATEADLTDARWLRRARWLDRGRLLMLFPQQADVIRACAMHGNAWYTDPIFTGSDSSWMSTGLRNTWNDRQAWTIAEDRWYNNANKSMMLAELWYRRWVMVTVIRTPDGRVVEYDASNQVHNVAVMSGAATVEDAIVPRVRRSYWLGPHCLFDGPTPYRHDFFPYAPFFGFTEDATGVPFGYVRDMIYPQDSVNSGISKLRWGMASVRTTRTKGATEMTDQQFRTMIARVDADIILDQKHMAQQGAVFKVERDFQLNGQQFQMLNDNRQAIERTSSITAGFIGRNGTARSGLQEQTQVEQSNQSLGYIMANFREGRALVGEMLLSMVTEDIGKRREVVVIQGDAVREDRTVVLNQPEVDPATGRQYLSNDILRTRLKVALEDVPSTPSYRGQQLNALSEVAKSLPPEVQKAVLPYMVSLMDTPYKNEIVEAIRAASQSQTPEQIEQMVKEAKAQAVREAGLELRARELEMRYSPEKLRAEIDLMVSKRVSELVKASYASMQAGQVIATIPQVAPIADVVMQSSGYRPPNPGGVDPNFPVPGQAAAMNIRSPYVQGQGAELGSEQLPMTRENTSPMLPPVPQDPSPLRGIETQRGADNIQ